MPLARGRRAPRCPARSRRVHGQRASSITSPPSAIPRRRTWITFSFRETTPKTRRTRPRRPMRPIHRTAPVARADPRYPALFSVHVASRLRSIPCRAGGSHTTYHTSARAVRKYTTLSAATPPPVRAPVASRRATVSARCCRGPVPPSAPPPTPASAAHAQIAVFARGGARIRTHAVLHSAPAFARTCR